MADVIRHRGPDSAGKFETPYGGLGFRRLSIIDLESGDQPILNEDSSLALICNGEIFNFKELRSNLLKRGHRFRTSSDVEVLLHLYEDHGLDMLQKLNGQFAFALLDLKKRELILARDHVGIAPLHFCIADNMLVFGSEIKSILKHPAVKRTVNLTGLDQVLTFPGLVSPQTIFGNIQRLQPGHFLRVNESGIQDFEYWDLIYPMADDIPEHKPEAVYIDELGEKLAHSVRYRLNADVPVGFYLSGGLDSSLIAAFIHKLEPTMTRHAFSIGFHDTRADEGRYQRLMADRVNCDLHFARFNSGRTAEMMRSMLYHAECPVKETYNTCSFELSRAARAEGIKVVLSGEGADELFAGYVGYRFDRIKRERLLKDVLTELEQIEEQMCETLWGDKKVRYELNYHSHRQQRRRLYSKDLQGSFHEFDCLRQPLVRKDRIIGRHPIHQRSYLDFKLRMADHLLMDHGDAMALANSVEARYPFLDIDLIRYAVQIPPELKLNRYTEKYILRKVGEDVLPKEILRREKFGWYAPGSPEMLQHRVEWILDMLSTDTIRRQGYFDPVEIENLKRQYSTPGFKLNQPYESDWLMVVATFGMLQELYDLPVCTNQKQERWEQGI
jgi:asparagine synthase (glutamine-hydrolysing)